MKNRILDILIAAMLLLLILLTVFYILSVTGLFSERGTADGSLSDGADYSVSDAFVMPETIAARGDLVGKFAVTADRKLISEMYAFLSPYISFILDSGSYEEAGGEYWKDCILSDNVIYIRYHGELSSSCISAHLGEKKPDACSPSSGLVFEMIIIPERGSYPAEYWAAVRDLEGRVLSIKCDFTDNAHMLFDIESFKTFESRAEMPEFYFFAEGNLSGISAQAGLADSAVIMDRSSMTHVVSRTVPEVSATEAAERLLGFQNSNYGMYEENGKTVYISTTGRLILSPGSLEYIAEEGGGVPLGIQEDYVGTAFEFSQLKRTELFVDSLKECMAGLLGGDAFLTLVSVHDRPAGGCEMTFIYLSDNIPVLDGAFANTGITVNVRNGMLLGIKADVCLIETGDAYMETLLPASILKIMTPGLGSCESTDLKLAYRTEDGIPSCADWILVSRRQNK